MSKYVDTMRLVFFTLMLYVWSAETILIPGEKQGEAKKDFILREFNVFLDARLSGIPMADLVHGMLSKLLGALIDWIVKQMNASADLGKLQAEIASFFPKA